VAARTSAHGPQSGLRAAPARAARRPRADAEESLPGARDSRLAEALAASRRG
jgi:hypothetical protein